MHKGHTNALRIIEQELAPDKIIVMPSKIPPHKTPHDLAGENDRLEMCRLAFSDFKNTEVSDFEIKNQGKSYSYYTVKYLTERFSCDEIFMAVGSDMLLSFDKWFRFEDILKMASLVCVSRENGDFNSLEKKAAELSKFGKIILIKARPFEISSTKIRRMLKNNQDTSCYLDEIVVKYIMENKIYCG